MRKSGHFVFPNELPDDSLDANMTDNIAPKSAAPLANRHPYSLRLHPDMHAELVRLAQESGIPLHAYLIDILNKHIRRKRSAHGR